MTIHHHEPDSSSWLAANFMMMLMILLVALVIIAAFILFRAIDDDDGGTIDVDLNNDGRSDTGGPGGTPDDANQGETGRWVAPDGSVYEVIHA